MADKVIKLRKSIVDIAKDALAELPRARKAIVIVFSEEHNGSINIHYNANDEQIAHAACRLIRLSNQEK